MKPSEFIKNYDSNSRVIYIVECLDELDKKFIDIEEVDKIFTEWVGELLEDWEKLKS